MCVFGGLGGDGGGVGGPPRGWEGSEFGEWI